MKSCIYEIDLRHRRNKPKKNNFRYSIYMFYLDLDELDILDRKCKFFGKNRFSLFGFYDSDHFKFIFNKKKYAQKIAKEKINFENKKYIGKNTKERIRTIIDELKLGFELDKVFLLTNLRNIGYIFNPVSFYFCYDRSGKLRAMFSEVNNTFHDQKMYYMRIDDPSEEVFTDRQRKNYYISPFIDYDKDILWKFREPGKYLDMKVSTVKDSEAILATSMRGKRKYFDDFGLLKIFIKYPMMTFMVIFYIHYQALKLWIKGIKPAGKKETDRRIYNAIKE